VIHLDLPRLLTFTPAGFEAEAVGVRPAPDRDQHHVRLDRLGLAALCGLNRESDAALRPLRLRHLGGGAKLEALLLEDPGRFLADLAVHPGQDLVQIFDDGDLRAEATPYGTELEPDDAAAYDDEAVRHLRKLERAGGIDDPLLIDLHARQRRHRGSGGDDDVLGAIFGAGDVDAVRRSEAAVPLQPGHLVLAEQEFDASGEPLHGLAAPAVHGIQVQLHRAQLHAPFGQRAVGGFLEQLGSVQQRLRRDAADIEAGAAERLPALDAGRLQPQLRRPDRGNIAARPGADHYHVKVSISHSNSLSRPASEGWHLSQKSR
jgi:hypothetical protein